MLHVVRVVAMAPCLSVSVRLSVTSRSSIKTDERIGLVLGSRASFYLSYTVLKRNSGVSKNTVLPSGILSQIPDLENFATTYRSSKRARWTLRA